MEIIYDLIYLTGAVIFFWLTNAFTRALDKL